MTRSRRSESYDGVNITRLIEELQQPFSTISYWKRLVLHKFRYSRLNIAYP